MPIHLNIDALAKNCAAYVTPTTIPQEQKERVLNRVAYNFKVTAFNAATVALVASVALTVLLSAKPFFLAIGLIALGARLLVHHDLNRTADDGTGDNPRAGEWPNQDAYVDRLRTHLGTSARWFPDEYSIGDCILWKNWVLNPFALSTLVDRGDV